MAPHCSGQLESGWQTHRLKLASWSKRKTYLKRAALNKKMNIIDQVKQAFLQRYGGGLYLKYVEDNHVLFRYNDVRVLAECGPQGAFPWEPLPQFDGQPANSIEEVLQWAE
jgi:hypothetical protein